MPKVWLSLSIILLLALFSLAGCSGETEAVKANLGQEFSLSLGQTVVIEGEELELRFLEVISDSRCAKDVTCIWQGQASCLVEITYFESLHRVTLTQPGLTEEPSEIDFKEYNISFNLIPYPEAGKEISKNDYRLRLVVTKPPLLSGGILVTFDVIGETFKVFITNKDTIADIFALQCGMSQATIPSGRIIKGEASYNEPWNWHIDSEDIHMAEVTIELCDGTPSQVEANLDYWVETVKRFCPWNARIIKIEDYR
ncbi:MAG TPA: hypothetical protein VMW64_06185 [Dehalococcoidia bacterium]|nr:hypothetical protein [Dehalococcoidia bacterium]